LTKECKFLQSWLRCCSSSKCWDAEARRRPLRRGCRCGCLKGRTGWGRSKGRSAETSRKTTIGCRTSPNDRETPTCQNKDLKFKHYFLNDLPQPLISHVQVRTNFTSLFCKKERKKEIDYWLFSAYFSTDPNSWGVQVNRMDILTFLPIDCETAADFEVLHCLRKCLWVICGFD